MARTDVASMYRTSVAKSQGLSLGPSLERRGSHVIVSVRSLPLFGVIVHGCPIRT